MAPGADSQNSHQAKSQGWGLEGGCCTLKCEVHGHLGRERVLLCQRWDSNAGARAGVLILNKNIFNSFALIRKLYVYQNIKPGALPSFLFYFFKFIYVIYLFLAVFSLRCCAWAFSSCGERGLLFVAVRGLLIAVVSLVVEHGCWACGLL